MGGEDNATLGAFIGIVVFVVLCIVGCIVVGVMIVKKRKAQKKLFDAYGEGKPMQSFETVTAKPSTALGEDSDDGLASQRQQLHRLALDRMVLWTMWMVVHQRLASLLSRSLTLTTRATCNSIMFKQQEHQTHHQLYSRVVVLPILLKENEKQ